MRSDPMKDLAAVRELSEDATPGVWSVDETERDRILVVPADVEEYVAVMFWNNTDAQHDAAFVVAAVNFIREHGATVEGLWEERERLQATLNNTLAERDAAEHVAQSSRISAIDAESRATRAEAALEKAELQLGCADDYAREWKAHCEAAEAALKEAGACGPIERDEGFDRTYIPLPAGWEVQTKGKGSTFRICEPDGHRLAIPNEPYLHETLERMAREINAACRPTPPTVTVEAPKDGR
jgi:hypothetical protein